ncbi:MAG: CDP-alcohol phosphatidyltransferase family protein [Oscillospiraceae bacterium]|nr:CDP-alcohol phosphatidyltransferase family protein [Oscillospiraceae bacterium]
MPLFVVAYFLDRHDAKILAVLVYALASFSDFLDGFLARKFKASSNLGKVLDPLGDKLMTITVMVCITIDAIIPVWAVLIAGIKEVLMAVGGLVMHKIAHVDIPPSNLLGKTSTVVFFLICVALMLFKDIPAGTAIIMISFAIALTIVALAVYLNRYITVMKNRGR